MKKKGLHSFWYGYVTGKNQPLRGLKKNCAQVGNFHFRKFIFSSVKIISKVLKKKKSLKNITKLCNSNINPFLVFMLTNSITLVMSFSSFVLEVEFTISGTLL